jgi:hypothetical protein
MGEIVQRWTVGACGLVVLAAVVGPIGATVRAQNLDEGKSAPKLFAEGCAACHRSARGLAKGRFSLTLFLFLQKHYASSSNSAWALTSYLESVDEAPRGRSRPKRARAAAGTPPSSLRPPVAVPQR